MWFDSWSDLVRVVLVGSAAYASLVLVLRVSGKRTLAKLNAFDLVVTVALGSTLATILLSADVAWTEGLTAFVVLVLLQLLVSWVTAHGGPGRSVVTARPTTVLRDGVVDEAALTAQRLTVDELRQAVRSSGVGGLDKVARVVLEADGTLSVVTTSQLGDGTALEPDDR
jgi:uncharacterized membrane protein YcaP (DUF421 family)